MSTMQPPDEAAPDDEDATADVEVALLAVPLVDGELLASEDAEEDAAPLDAAADVPDVADEVDARDEVFRLLEPPADEVLPGADAALVPPVDATELALDGEEELPADAAEPDDADDADDDAAFDDDEAAEAVEETSPDPARQTPSTHPEPRPQSSLALQRSRHSPPSATVSDGHGGRQATRPGDTATSRANSRRMNRVRNTPPAYHDNRAHR